MARRQLRLAPDEAINQEGERPAGGGDIETDREDIQHTDAPAKEGAPSNKINIDNNNTCLKSATALQGKRSTDMEVGQPAKNDAAHEGGEQEEEETMDSRRNAIQELRATVALLNKWEVERIESVEKQMEAERIENQEKDNIWEGLNGSSNGDTTGVGVRKGKSEAESRKKEEPQGSLEKAPNSDRNTRIFQVKVSRREKRSWQGLHSKILKGKGGDQKRPKSTHQVIQGQKTGQLLHEQEEGPVRVERYQSTAKKTSDEGGPEKHKEKPHEMIHLLTQRSIEERLIGASAGQNLIVLQRPYPL